MLDISMKIRLTIPWYLCEWKWRVISSSLWFFLGVVGVHRFYLGHIGLGVLYLLTFGLCGVGWLIDGILFLTGDLKPANGKAYGEKII